MSIKLINPKWHYSHITLSKVLFNPCNQLFDNNALLAKENAAFYAYKKALTRDSVYKTHTDT